MTPNMGKVIPYNESAERPPDGVVRDGWVSFDPNDPALRVARMAHEARRQRQEAEK